VHFSRILLVEVVADLVEVVRVPHNVTPYFWLS
jgi:hypothetical protein